MIDLYKMRFLMRRIPKLKWDLAKEQARATKITSVLTGMPHGSGTHSQVEDGAIRISIVNDRIREVMNELEEMRKELTLLIESIDNPVDKLIVQLRYLDGMTIEEISEVTGKSERQLYRILNRLEYEIEKRGQNL